MLTVNLCFIQLTLLVNRTLLPRQMEESLRASKIEQGTPLYSLVPCSRSNATAWIRSIIAGALAWFQVNSACIDSYRILTKSILEISLNHFGVQWLFDSDCRLIWYPMSGLLGFDLIFKPNAFLTSLSCVILDS